LEGFSGEVGAISQVENCVWVFGAAAEGLKGFVGGGMEVKGGFLEGGEQALF
jgi:hypothetical protein